MKKAEFLAIAALLFLFGLAAGRVVIIPSDYQTIQEGINSCSDGDTVLVKPGIYYENINFNGHNIVVASFYFINHDPQTIEQTIIDGNQTGSVVTFDYFENNNAILTGFTIRNGHAPAGGGICCDYFVAPTIINNIISDNSTYSSGQDSFIGGGIYCHNSNPIISDNMIRNNNACYGGGIYCNESSPIIQFNAFVENLAVP